MLLNLFLNKILICFDGTLNCICIQINIKVYVFMQKSIYPIQDRM